MLFPPLPASRPLCWQPELRPRCSHRADLLSGWARGPHPTCFPRPPSARAGTLQTPGESLGLEAGAANTKASWWLAPLPTLTPRQAWTQKHVPYAAQGVLSVIPISPAFRFGLLEAAGGGLVLEDAPYSWGKLAPGQQHSPGVPPMGKGAHPQVAGWDALALSPPPPALPDGATCTPLVSSKEVGGSQQLSRWSLSCHASGEGT